MKKGSIVLGALLAAVAAGVVYLVVPLHLGSGGADPAAGAPAAAPAAPAPAAPAAATPHAVPRGGFRVAAEPPTAKDATSLALILDTSGSTITA